MNRPENQNPCYGGTDCQCPSGKYYVSCMDSHDTSKFWLMAGPYPTHREAEADNRVIDEMKIPETKVVEANIRRLENK